MKKIHKCKVCRKGVRQSSGPGRPKTTHTRCKGKKKTPRKKTKKKAKKKAKKKTKKKAKKKKAKKKAIKRSKTTRRRGSTTRSRQGREIMGAVGWISLYSGKGTSDKTWAVKVEKKGSRFRVLTRHGRAGLKLGNKPGEKNVTTHPWKSETAAVRQANSLLRSKLTQRKGYEFYGANRRKRRHKSRR